jgi:hypothetical protein
VVSVGGTGVAVAVSVAGGNVADGTAVSVAVGGKGVAVSSGVWVGGTGVGSGASVLQLARARLRMVTMITIFNRKLVNSIGVLHEEESCSVISSRFGDPAQKFLKTISSQSRGR